MILQKMQSFAFYSRFT